MDISLPFVATLIGAFVLALVLTPLSRILAIASGFIDYPRNDRVHRRPTPFLGGLAVALSAGLAFAILAPRLPGLTELWDRGTLPRAAVPTTLFVATGALLLGLIDDRFVLSPLQKLVGQIVLSVAFLAPLVPATWSWTLLLWPIGLLWMVGQMNAFNLLDNMDGILSGIGALIGLFMGVMALQLGRPDMAALALAAGGASLGFLCFNFPPATIFLGDAGAFFIGFLLAAVGWQLAGHEFLSFGSPAAAAVLILAYPIFDVTFVTVTRLIEHRPVYVGGIDHTTHRLHAILGRNKRALWTVYGLNALCGLAGLGALKAPAPVAWSLVVVAIGLYASLGVVLARVPVRSNRFLSVFLKSTPPAEREVA